MHFHRTRSVLDTLNNISNDPFLEGYMLEYVLIVFYNELEENLKNVIGDFLEKKSDSEISNFISNNLNTILKRTEKKDLKKTLKLFSEEKAAHFDEILKQEAESLLRQYSGFIENRHNVAHSDKSITMSKTEMQEMPAVGEKIIDCFKSALNYNSQSDIERI